MLLVFQLGQPRIFFSMARDGLLPPCGGQVHPRFRTPHVTTILTGVAVGVPAMFVDIDEVVELTNIGTLFAFVLVSAGVIVLRRTRPGAAAAVPLPGVPVVPLLSIVCCIGADAALPLITWMRFVVWQAAGVALYFLYGRRHSRLAKQGAGGDHVDAHYEQVMAARERLGDGPSRAYFAYSTVLDPAAFEEWRHQHGYDFFQLPSASGGGARPGAGLRLPIALVGRAGRGPRGSRRAVVHGPAVRDRAEGLAHHPGTRKARSPRMCIERRCGCARQGVSGSRWRHHGPRAEEPEGVGPGSWRH